MNAISTQKLDARQFGADLARIDTTIIHHTAFSAAKERLQANIEMSLQAKLTGAVALIGLSGVGKTLVLQRFKADFEAANPQKRNRCVMFEMPNNITYRALGIQLLAQLGSPQKISRSTTEAEISEAVARQYEASDVECIALDETQRLINRSNSRDLENVGNALTSIMNLVKKPLILAGTPEIDQLRKAFGPLARRIQATIKLEPLDTKSEEGLRDLKRIIKQINDNLPAKLPAWILQRDGLDFMRKYTGGIIGVLLPLIRHAARSALQANEHEISVERLKNSAAEMESHTWQQVGQANSAHIRVNNVFQSK